jgi:bifunctional non-homologous end joining protein LigD
MATRTRRTTKSPARRAGGRLSKYNAKRNLAVSGEPAGRTANARTGSVRRFVIQKHDATRLHYDLRLEMDGVYRSWAVPKGLPVTPGERSLAVEVEDHPLEYGTFEGVIPEGNYGAGTVMLWDRGHYAVSGVEPEVAYREGKLHLALAGEKCVGEWTLVRMHPKPGDRHTNWLIIKNSSPAHRAPINGKARDLSVLSGRSLEQIAGGQSAEHVRHKPARGKPPAQPRRDRARAPRNASRGRATPGEATLQLRETNVEGMPPTSRRSVRDATGTSHSRSALKVRKSSPARALRRRGSGGAVEHLVAAEFIAPMKALSVDEVPSGKWRLEIKLDGYRAVAVLNDGNVELWSRNHKPLTAEYPEVTEALQAIPCTNAVIDGEIVALDAEGRSRFQLLQNRGESRPSIVYYVFDLLHHDGRSLLQQPIEERRIALEMLVGKGSTALRCSPVFDLSPDALLAEVRDRQLEGIIAKRPGSLYEPDRRSGAWLKCKVHGEQEFVIGGFTPPKNSRPYFGAILVGYFQDGKLLYAGKVGSGFNVARLGALHRELMKRRTPNCPFANLPATRRSRFGTGMTRSVMKEVTWVEPGLVAQIQFTEWTEEGSLRHPVFLGLREDKKASDVVREGFRSASAAKSGRARGAKT